MRCPRIPEHNPYNVDLVRYFVINVRFETQTYKKQASRVVILVKLFVPIIYIRPRISVDFSPHRVSNIYGNVSIKLHIQLTKMVRVSIT